MQQQVIYPEYKIGPNGLAASYASQSGYRSFFAAAFLAVVLCVPVLSYKFRLSGDTKVITRGLGSSEVFSLGAENKELFLSIVSIRERRELASKIHYVGEIVKATGKFPNSWKTISAAIVLESKRANIDPFLVTALVKSESTFNPFAKSNQGALGLMQLLPGTGEYISKVTKTDWQGTHRLENIEYNLRLGIAYLKYLRRYFGDNVEQALIAYNWGPGNLLKAIKNSSKVPQSPLDYAKKILGNHSRWRDDYQTRKAEYQYIQISDIAVG